MALYQVMEMADGEEIDSESGPINLHLEPADSSAEVHIESPECAEKRGNCPVTGNTYHRKETIKTLPYGDGGTQWTGETWIVAEEQTANLAAVLAIAGVDVSIHKDAVACDSAWGWYYEQENPEGPGSEGQSTDEPAEGEIVIGKPADANEEKVSSGWVETLVEWGIYSSVGDYANRFDVDLLWDEDMMDGYILCRDTDGTDVFDTRKVSPF